MLKKSYNFLFIFLFFFFSGVSNVFASDISLYSERYILYNLNEDEILTESKSHEETNIASLTKIMTVLVAVENIDNFDKKITITDKMLKNIAWDVAVIGLKTGDKVTYNDLLYGSILGSGADAVNALAISISGDFDKYTSLMNEKAKLLGMKNTKYANVTGLYDKDNYSSAYDIALLLKYALKNEKFKEVFETKQYTTSNNIKIKSTIYSYNTKNDVDVSYITGAKTGYISKAGYCLASTATINKVDYLFVSLNSFSDVSASHIKDAINIYTYYSSNYSYQTIVTNDDVIVTLPTKYAKEKNVDIVSGVNIKKYLKNDFDKSKVEYDYKGLEQISYFTKEGITIGNVKIMYDGKELSSFDVIYKATLSFSILSFIWLNKLYISLFLIIIILLVLIKKKLKKKRKIKKIYKY